MLRNRVAAPRRAAPRASINTLLRNGLLFASHGRWPSVSRPSLPSALYPKAFVIADVLITTRSRARRRRRRALARAGNRLVEQSSLITVRAYRRELMRKSDEGETLPLLVVSKLPYIVRIMFL